MGDYLRQCERERQLERIRGKAKRRASSSGPRYPLADPPVYGHSNYRDHGGRHLRMTPARFLAVAPPLVRDEETEENVELLVEHMKAGRDLDAPMLEYSAAGDLLNHDGRHRAIAAQQMGIKKIPVLVFGPAPKGATA